MDWASNVINLSLQLLISALENYEHSYNFTYVTRDRWQARPPRDRALLPTPVPFVIIHHTFNPTACYTLEDCCAAMRLLQDKHMDEKGWADIAYNFGVGSDGAVYEGRGWKILGAHSRHFNIVSIGIALIGDWSYEVPPAEQLDAAKALITTGVKLGYINSDYKLIGHRQASNIKSPADALSRHIQTWAHYSSMPRSPKDIIYIQEIPMSIRKKIIEKQIAKRRPVHIITV